MKHTQPPKAYWLIFLISLVSVLHGCAAKAPETEKQGPQVVLSKIEPREVDGKTEIIIAGNAPILQYTSFQLTEPLRLVVDIADADIGTLRDRLAVNQGAVADITPSQKDNIARLEIGLTHAVESKVYQSDGKLVIEFIKPVEEAKTIPEITTAASETTPPAPPQEQAPPPSAEKKETEQPEKAAATVVTSVRASAGKEGVKVVITADGAMSSKAFMVSGNKLVVDIPGVKSRVRPSVIPVRKGGLDKVRVGQHAAPDQKVRVVLDLTKPMQYTVTPEENTVLIAMNESPPAKAQEQQPQERAAAQEPEKAAPTEKEVAAPQPPQQTTEVAAAPAPPATGQRAEAHKPNAGAEAALVTGAGRFSGRRISLDLQDADLVNVMRLFAEIANLNVILAPDVRGKVTVRMVNIPWDQAMDIILKMNGLGYALEDNILRIASVSALTKEAEEDLRSKEAKKKAEDLITRIVPINYATASGIEGTIKKSLSARGETVTDTRTNTLIIKDIPRNVDEVVALIKLLDKPIPQIMIEARIVEASLNFSRQLGVQWGGNFKADASHGNPTGVTFPNAAGVTGGPTMGTTPSGNGNFLVNMPAAAGAGTGGGAVGFTFGSIGKALNLDLVLSALESTGEGKIISSPRVSALDNKEAKIEQGVSIPFSTTSAGGTQIQFIDAKLALTVTPHATPDKKIFMKIQATKNAPDTSILGASGQPSIRKNEATTEILLADGETAVIGGILTTNKTVAYTKVPFFADIPLIGWLFKTKTTSETKGELLIFITPRVVKQEVI
jgi:type IV pilus secretin PilQ/predicted competence protein